MLHHTNFYRKQKNGIVTGLAETLEFKYKMLKTCWREFAIPRSWLFMWWSWRRREMAWT